MKAWFILILLMIPIATALEECMREETPSNIPCYLITGWTPSSLCSNYNATIYNESGNFLSNRTFGTIGESGRCNVTFNYTSNGQYLINSSIATWNVLVKSEDNMTSLGIIIFLLMLNVVLFGLPFFVQFTKNAVGNDIIKKIVWLTALAILAFNTTILASLADNAGLGITHEIFVFQWFFMKGLYAGMILIFWSFFIQTPKIWKQQKVRQRMGEE